MNARLRFDAAIVGMLDTIRDAADPHYPEWSPYRGRIAGQPAWWARYVMREARKLGLIPSTAVLEAEVRDHERRASRRTA